MILMD
jgi:condensin complex subunit 3